MNEEAIINLIQLSISMGIVEKTKIVKHIASTNLVGKRKVAAVINNFDYQYKYWIQKKGAKNTRIFELL